MKGIVLAGGSGTRLYPLTRVTSKQLLPVHDKPMVYYPLSVLMMAGIRDILIISTPSDTPKFKQLLGNGHMFGINLSYEVQENPEGLVQAFRIGQKFGNNEPTCLILGDNIFYGSYLKKMLQIASENVANNVATVFGYYVKDPERFGVVEFDENENAISLEEKPKYPKSNYAVTGLYFYPGDVYKKSESVEKSIRGEFEITTLNQMYLHEKRLKVIRLGRGYTWLDAGTHESLTDASYFIMMLEKHQGLKVACLEEIAYINGWITREELIEEGNLMKNNEYGKHLLNVANNKIIY
jgi:glucose-1-phosphate thymidylyltransferase